jgi:hypothetical protein
MLTEYSRAWKTKILSYSNKTHQETPMYGNQTLPFRMTERQQPVSLAQTPFYRPSHVWGKCGKRVEKGSCGNYSASVCSLL